jgi:6,7-dimethyl-8-ribityllumazine synthase
VKPETIHASTVPICAGVVYSELMSRCSILIAFHVCVVGGQVKPENIYASTVPGAFELPLATRFLALSRQCDVIITLGCLIKGETMHFEYISEAVAHGLMDVREGGQGAIC